MKQEDRLYINDRIKDIEEVILEYLEESNAAAEVLSKLNQIKSLLKQYGLHSK